MHCLAPPGDLDRGKSIERHANPKSWMNLIELDRPLCVCVDWAQWFLSRKSLFYSENIFWFRANIEREGGKRDGAKERERIKWRRYNKEFYDCEEGRPSKDDGFGHGFEASTSREWVPVPKRTGPLKTRRKGACSNAIKTRLDYSNRKEEEEEE